MYERTTLPSGLRVITSTMPHLRSASILIYYKVGARSEPASNAGISHYIEHMLFKGTKRRQTPQEISEAIEGLGGSLNAMTDREYTTYTALVPSQHFDLALDVLTDMLKGSRFDPAEVERERAVIIEEINGTLDSPPDIANETIAEVMWPDQAIGRPIAGTHETVGQISRDAMLAYMGAHYVPAATVVSVAGQVEHDAVVEAVGRQLGRDAAPGSVPGYERAVAAQDAPRARLVAKDTEQAHLCLGLPALSYNDSDRYVQQMLNGVLGGGMSSRLFVEIREKRALAYTIESYADNYEDAGSLIVYAGVDNERVESCLQGVLHELDRLRQDPVPASELRKVKEYRKGNLLLALESSSAVAGWGGRQELLRDSIESVDDVLAGIEAVTAGEVQDLAGRLFQEARLNLCVVGPFEDEDAYRELLRLA